MWGPEYESMFHLEDTYWWFVARRKLVAELIRRAHLSAEARILDVGCGTGATLEMLRGFGRVQGVDSSETAAEICREKRALEIAVAEVESLPFDPASFDAVTCLDVLEHTDDDVAALREIHRVCSDGATLILTVPAYGFLWSEHDEALKHRRRYTAHELRNRLSAASFDIKHCSYFITALFFPILAVRIFQGLFKRNLYPATAIRPLPGWLNQLFVWLLDVERALMRVVNLPFGVSIIAVATANKKPSEPKVRL